MLYRAYGLGRVENTGGKARRFRIPVKERGTQSPVSASQPPNMDPALTPRALNYCSEHHFYHFIY